MRVTNWSIVLAAEIEFARVKPFAWGSWDCCQFAARVVMALTGVDHTASFPQYTTQTQAWDIVEAAGGMQKMLESVLGPSKHVSAAHRGDILLADLGAGLQPAVCMGALLAAPGPKGLNYGPTNAAVVAWSV